jgi:hypothetical protein
MKIYMLERRALSESAKNRSPIRFIPVISKAILNSQTVYTPRPERKKWQAAIFSI